MSVKDSVMLQKFKDGVQDTVVFLRMLEQFKIPAVMETRRKKLLEKLLHLQSDTIREVPPSYEDGVEDGEETAQKSEKVLKRTGSVVDDKVKEFARMDNEAKKEMEQLTPKRKAAAPSAGTVENGLDTSTPERGAQREKEGKEDQGSPQRPVSMVSATSETGSAREEENAVDGEKAEEGEKEAEGEKEEVEKEEKGKGKKKKRLGVGLKLKAKLGLGKKGAAPIVEQQLNGSVTEKDGESVTEVQDGEHEKAGEGAGPAEGEGEGKGEEGAGEKEAEVEEELEEGVKIKSNLEKRVSKRFGGHSWVPISGKLKETTLILTMDKKEKQLELVGCTVAVADSIPNGLELFCHPEQKQWVFRVENEALRDKWVQELQAAIDQCAAAQPPEPEPTEPEAEEEKHEEEVPAIVVEPVEEEEPTKRKRSFAVSPKANKKTKPLNEVPDQGVQKSGYVYRRKGPFGGWEKAYCVVTFTAMYFTAGEEVKEYHHMCLLGGTGSVKKEKKGHDKQSESVVIKSGKSKEVLSVAPSDIPAWKETLENVLGLTGSCELLSEDEDEADAASGTAASGTAEPILEDLYEELPGEEDDIRIEEDIYEEFDDVPRIQPDEPPSLPQRNEPKPSPYEPGPALPPRNELTRQSISSEPVPTLPPRGGLSSSPRASPKLPTKEPHPISQLPTQTSEDAGEELYEDVVGPGGGGGGGGEEDVGGEELYEDVVPQPIQEVEETYDDIAASGQIDSPGEEYTEMDAGEGQDRPLEEYVLMEPGEEEQEMYCEVDPDTPPHAVRKGAAVTNSPRLPPKSPHSGQGVGSIKKPAPPVTYVPKHSGKLSHKPPKKSRFYEEWCKMEGTDLCTYRSQTDKRVVEKIPLREYDMHFGPGEGGKFAFKLTKGEKVHHFNLGSKEELSGWVGALRDSAKSATLELPPGEKEVYQAVQDHTAENDEQISFKSGAYIRVVSHDSAEWCIGQLGTSSEVFSGKIGKFPVSKVTVAEDLYI